MIETKRLNIIDATGADIQTIIKLETHKDNCDFIWSGTYEEHKAEIQDKNHLIFVFKRDEIINESQKLNFNLQDIGLGIGDVKFEYKSNLINEN